MEFGVVLVLRSLPRRTAATAACDEPDAENTPASQVHGLWQCMSAEQFEIVVIGSGFGGSLMAMIARRLGFSTALVERGKHPRFVIGESTTPLTNLLLEALAREYDLPGVLPLCKWGSWQQHAPQLAW